MHARRTSLRSRIPFVAQLTASECAVACLAMVLGHHGRAVPRGQLRAALGTGRDGASAHALLQAARTFGLTGRGVRLDASHLHRLAPGAVLHWEAKHFVVLERATPQRAWILDPARGRRCLSRAEAASAFSGLALVFELEPTAGPRVEPAASEGSPSRRAIGAALRRPRSVAPVLAAAGLSTALGLAGARLMAEFVARLSEPEPRFADALGLAAVVVLATAATRAWRERGQDALGVAVERALGRPVIERLLRLPPSFFRRRTASDLARRAAGARELGRRLALGVGALLTEGPMALGFALTLGWWSPVMLLTAALVILAHGLAGAALRRRVSHRAGAAARAEAEVEALEARLIEQAALLQATSDERAVMERWSQRRHAAATAALAHGRARAVDQGVLEGFAALIPLVLLAVGAHEVATGALSLPAMIGTNCLAVALFRPAAVMTAAVQSLAAAPAVLDRIDDVLLEPLPPAPTHDPAVELPGTLELREVTLGLGPAPVLDSISITIEPARHVAITGDPASGKSGLAALLAGLERPDRGRVLLGGRDLAQARVRACLVPAAAPLLDGDLFDNVALGADAPTPEAVMAACRLAGVHEQIEALPLGYRTAVYDGGKALPAGLRQRIVLARALARRPELLVLDEAAASLGAAAEGRLVDALLSEGSVRTLVTVTPHRSTIARADRVVTLHRGHVVDATETR